jgi:ribulose-5-phosphate 4-epimerase/fuculose-1-phosphate aldolase
MDTSRTTKEQVLAACRFLAERGLLVGTGGNVSLRIDGQEAFAITPTSTDYMTMTPDDICIVDFQQQQLEGPHPPSVEVGMHAAVHRGRLDVGCVIHTHQPHASAFALIEGGIPALFDEQVLNLGESVELVPYGISGSTTLLENIGARLPNQCNAYVLQNHGALVLGMTAELALRNVLLLEKCAQTYAAALQTGRPITALPAESVATFGGLLHAAQKKEIRRRQRLARTGEAAPANPSLSEKA